MSSWGRVNKHIILLVGHIESQYTGITMWSSHCFSLADHLLAAIYYMNKKFSKAHNLKSYVSNRCYDFPYLNPLCCNSFTKLSITHNCLLQAAHRLGSEILLFCCHYIFYLSYLAVKSPLTCLKNIQVSAVVVTI